MPTPADKLLTASQPLHCGIFGGTFDPFHLGHAAAIRQVIHPTGLDQVRVIPSASPPHRDDPGASAEQRLAMVQIALADEPGLLVDDRELLRNGNSYTFDTVTELRAELDNTRFSLILGLDAAMAFDQWYRWRELLQLVNIIVMGRPGWQLPEKLPGWWLSATAAPADDSAGRICIMDIKPLDISASRIRRSIRDGTDVSGQLEPGVLAYIRQHHLYTRNQSASDSFAGNQPNNS